MAFYLLSGLIVISSIYALYTRQLFSFIIGISTFTLSQIFFRLPIIIWLESTADYQLWATQHIILSLFFLAASAGIVEEIARWFALYTFRNMRACRQIVAFGLGHGSMEIFFFIWFTTSMAVSYWGVFERFCAIIIHICLSFFVLKSVTNKQQRYFYYAIAIHTFVNLFSVLFLIYHSIFLAEGFVFFITILLFIWTIRSQRRRKLN